MLIDKAPSREIRRFFLSHYNFYRYENFTKQDQEHLYLSTETMTI